MMVSRVNEGKTGDRESLSTEYAETHKRGACGKCNIEAYSGQLSCQAGASILWLFVGLVLSVLVLECHVD